MNKITTHIITITATAEIAIPTIAPVDNPGFLSSDTSPDIVLLTNVLYAFSMSLALSYPDLTDVVSSLTAAALFLHSNELDVGSNDVKS